ncbi:MAG TPA: PLP-dependent aminotransferase family protein [Polyangiaceae bacterium]|nr:PLP-dependent aminotransferase family protein [Polyangiaceae bacterium]
MAAAAESPLYERLAHDLGASIAKGQLRAGDRLPSVRRLARERSVSVATVLQAYFELENEGLVEVRPKSGHFVRRERGPELLEPSTPRRSSVPSEITVSAAVAALVASVRDPNVVALGSAVMAAELLPIAKLNRILSEIAREMSTAGAGYDAPPGLPTLRRQLARRAVLTGLPLREDDFVTTVGAMEALHIALRAVVRPGETIAIESPTYFGVMQLIEEMGIKALEIPMHPRTGMDLDALQAGLKGGGIKAIFSMPTVSNPLGSVMPDENKRRLMSLLEKHDVPLIEDDVYGDLLFDGSRPAPVKALDRDGRVLYVGSVSKTLAPGYRVGWIAAGRYQSTVERLKFTQSVATPTMPQMAVAEFLASGGYDRHLRKTRRLLSVQVDRTREAIARHFPAGTRVSDPRGGYVVWVELPGNVSSFSIQRRALERGISVAPGPIFSAGGRFENHLRLNAGVVWSERIERSLEVLGDIIKELSS